MDRLTPNVQHALVAYFVYLDELLAKTQAACEVPRTARLFYQYKIDISAPRRDELFERIAQFRQLLNAFGIRWAVELPMRQVLSSHVAKVDLRFLEVALDEMSPGTLSGYGALGAEFEADYRALLESLRASVASMTAALPTEAGG